MASVDEAAHDRAGSALCMARTPDRDPAALANATKRDMFQLEQAIHNQQPSRCGAAVAENRSETLAAQRRRRSTSRSSCKCGGLVVMGERGRRQPCISSSKQVDEDAAEDDKGHPTSGRVGAALSLERWLSTGAATLDLGFAVSLQSVSRPARSVY
ncbi:hypothetical protein MKZ38_001339 [Zalerion maritima]|uniref:Uncharacterized protein n=1 Tax=Zalerion maritima TaxID=339359 RepID=A0AAD5REZ7_9PEZI|nr:hypothetical protein MKZ38_001339 [Zalerion maritima]